MTQRDLDRPPDEQPVDPADQSNPTLQPQTTEDDYSGTDGGTSNVEAVAASQGDGPTQAGPTDPEQQPPPPEETRSPTPPQRGL